MKTNNMKKLITLIGILLIAATSHAQLNASADTFRSNAPDVYQALRTYSTNKWSDNHDMVVYEINKQAVAMLEFMDYFTKADENKDTGKLELIFRSLEKWTKNYDPEIAVENPGTNWEMVVYEIEKQLKSYKTY